MEYCTHVYYGTGKGKTTAAVGLAVRAAGAGCRVLFCQFLKSGETAELSVLQSLPGVTVLRPKKLYPFTSQMTDGDRASITEEHDQILCAAEEALSGISDPDEPVSAFGKEADPAPPVLVVLDELAWAFHYDLIDRQRVLSLLDTKQAEFVITGRVCVREFTERADYVTNLQEEKHPYHRGVSARRGIEY